MNACFADMDTKLIWYRFLTGSIQWCIVSGISVISVIVGAFQLFSSYFFFHGALHPQKPYGLLGTG